MKEMREKLDKDLLVNYMVSTLQKSSQEKIEKMEIEMEDINLDKKYINKAQTTNYKLTFNENDSDMYID
jgi:hypothetical protein